VATSIHSHSHPFFAGYLLPGHQYAFVGLDSAVIAKEVAARRWLAFVVIGVLVFSVAAAKGVFGLKLDDPGWRIGLAIVGLLLAAIGIWDGIRKRDDEADLGKEYGLKITSPGENANVPEEFDVQGTYEDKPPPNVSIRVFVHSPTSGRYWPTRSPIIFDQPGRRWSVTVRTGGSAGEIKYIGIAVLGKNAQLLCKHYDAVTDHIIGLRTKYHDRIGLPGIPEMPADWKESQRVRVRRV
jgi:hypothetical protein